MSERIIFSISASTILKASKAGIREKDWRERLNKLGGENICGRDGAIQCSLPQSMWAKAKTDMEKFARSNLFPDAMVFEKIPGIMVIELGGICTMPTARTSRYLSTGI